MASKKYLPALFNLQFFYLIDLAPTTHVYVLMKVKSNWVKDVCCYRHDVCITFQQFFDWFLCVSCLRSIIHCYGCCCKENLIINGPRTEPTLLPQPRSELPTVILPEDGFMRPFVSVGSHHHIGSCTSEVVVITSHQHQIVPKILLNTV